MNVMMNTRQQAFCKQLISKADSSSKQALMNILSQQPVDLEKLQQFTLTNILPSNYRPLVWKLLLHITPRFSESQEFVHNQHSLIFEDLFQALKILRLGVPVTHQHSGFNGSSHLGSRASLRLYRNGWNGHLSETKNPEPEHFFLMWLISEARLLRNPEMQLNAVENQKYILIGHKLSTSNIFDDNVDLYHICASLWTLLRNNEEKLKDAVQNAFGLLRKHHDTLHRHLWQVGLFTHPLIDEHCSSLFCEILTDSAIENIIDKLFAGSFAILSYVIVALLCQLQNELMTANSVESVRNALYQIRKEQADTVLIVALDFWHSKHVSKCLPVTHSDH